MSVGRLVDFTQTRRMEEYFVGGGLHRNARILYSIFGAIHLQSRQQT